MSLSSAGASSADRLRSIWRGANLRVAVLDRQELMREASWAAAGMLSPAPDCPAAIPLVPLGRASLALYPKFVDAVEDASGLRTGFRTGGAIEAICHGDAERELSTLVALHHGLGLACEPLPLDEATEHGTWARAGCARGGAASGRMFDRAARTDGCGARRRGFRRRGAVPRC